MIRRIFSALEGTLLNSRGHLTTTTATTILTARIPVTLISTQAPIEMAKTIDRLGLRSAQIGFNGAVVFKRSHQKLRILSAFPIENVLADALIHCIQMQFPTVGIGIYDVDRWYTDTIGARLLMGGALTKPATIVASLVNALNRDGCRVFKLRFVSPNFKTTSKLMQTLANLQVATIRLQRVDATTVEVTSREAIRERGVNFVLAHDCLYTSETVGITHSQADAGLMHLVGMTVAMGNADNDLKQRASYVTTSNDDNGVAQAFRVIRQRHI